VCGSLASSDTALAAAPVQTEVVLTDDLEEQQIAPAWLAAGAGLFALKGAYDVGVSVGKFAYRRLWGDVTNATDVPSEMREEQLSPELLLD
jgi:hypothetical protein